ncbi:MAG: NAD(P)H-quinone dehydrogenase [Actinobacteria bacterium]|nr:NAD(P)H-quinone dehydrogenase [Actinomycetota bacterium]
MHIVIIGGGPAGYEAALVAAEHEQQVTVVSTEGLGGNSVLWDSVPSKALIVSADAMGWMQSADRLGVRLADGSKVHSSSEVDMASVLDRVARLANNQSDDITTKLDRAGVDVVYGTGRLTGPTSVAVMPNDRDPYDVECDMVLLATGSNPRILPFFEPDGRRVFTARELFSLDELPERLIVVGSGATGAEYANAFARFGSEVHLISSREQVLPSEDPDAARVIEGSFEDWGMVIHRERRAVDVDVRDDGVRVRTELSRDGDVVEGGSEWVEASHVLFCVGQVPASDDIGLADVGVDVEDWGAIPVDGVSRTNMLTVYAAGDVTGGMMLASTAAMQGRNAIWHFLGKSVQPLRSDVISRCVFTSPEVASVGIPTQRVAEYPDGAIESVTLQFRSNPRAKMTEHTNGFVKLHSRRGSGTVLGGVVCANSASDLITPLSVAVRNRLTVEQVAHAFTIYPSMAGSIQETARLLLARQPDEAVY